MRCQSRYSFSSKAFTLLVSLFIATPSTRVFAASIPHRPSPTSHPFLLSQGRSSNTRADQLFDTGNQHLERGEFREALQPYQQAAAEYRKAGDKAGTGFVLTNLGIAYYRLSQYQKALDALQPALPLHGEVLEQLRTSSGETARQILHSRAALRVTARHLGLVYYQLGQYPKAFEFYEQAFARGYGRSIGEDDCAWDGKVLNDVGYIYLQQGGYRQSLRFYRRALDIIDEIGYTTPKDITSMRRLSLCLGNTQFNNILGRPFNQADEPDPKGYDPIKMKPWARVLLVTTFNNIGDAYQKLGPASKAMEFYLQALKFSRLVDDRSLQGRTLNNVGRMYANRGQDGAAMEFFQEALKLSRAAGDRALEGTTLNTMGMVLFQAGKHQEASNRFLEAVKAWESTRPGLTDADLVSLFETQMETYRWLQRSLVAQNKTESALEVAERGRARAFVELLAKRIATDRPSGSESPAQSPSIQQIKQIARQQQATLVTYSLISDELVYAWTVSPGGAVNFRQIDLKAVLQPQRLSFAQYVENARMNGLGIRGRGANRTARRGSDTPPTSSELQQLHRLLIQPIAQSLPTDPNARVIFIPQGALFLVPFAALQDSSGKSLIESHTPLVAPSIQVLQLTRQQKSQPAAANRQSPSSLIVGNPTMPAVVVQAGLPPEQLSSLPGAEEEARAIAQLLNAKPLIGNEATETSVVQQMPQAKLIHLATHGLMDDFKGLGVPGALALAPSEGSRTLASSGNSDGLLTAGELLNLRLNADLVVLSACDTGRGKITGDGVIGLSRSLISAGAPSVIVSLWAVPDGSTAFLMTEFYRNLQKTPDKAQALRQAMLATQKSYSDPVNWAAFVLIGEAD
jgi:CHAT domain-containing protein